MTVSPETISLHPEKYDYLVNHEDYRKNLMRKIFTRRDIRGLDIVEIGAGTGRLTFQICPFAKYVTAYEPDENLLKVARAKKETRKVTNCVFLHGSPYQIPLKDKTMDVAIEGWNFPQIIASSEDVWQATIKRSLTEMQRVIRPGGTIFLIESLGILEEEPVEPKFFHRLYKEFESQYGFQRDWVRTDYQFESAAQAEYYIGLFCGPEAAAKIREQNLSVIPACTGIWYLTQKKPDKGNG